MSAFAASSSLRTDRSDSPAPVVHPLDPIRRVEPPVAQLDEPLSFQGFCHLLRRGRAAVPSFLGSCYSLLRVRSLVPRKGLCETVQAFADGRPRLCEVY